MPRESDRGRAVLDGQRPACPGTLVLAVLSILFRVLRGFSSGEAEILEAESKRSRS